MINLSIIILSWNTKLLLMQCLESLVKNLEGRSEIELIVVDNASVDGSQEMVEENFPKVKLIKNKINFGFALGNNMGIGAALGKYIMLLNSDTVVKKGAIKKLLAYLGNNDNCAVSPLLVLPDGCPQFDYYMHFPNLWQVFFYHNPLLRPAMMRTSIKKLVYQEAKEIPFKVDQLPGAALMTSKEVWQKVGDLDSDFQFLWEDVDWSWRARKNGVKLMVVPEA
jgi:GT2 family glycosyltransferase